MIPEFVKIGAKVYQIQVQPCSEALELGHCIDSMQLIRIESSLPNSEKEETLLHEILHAAIKFVGLFPGNDGEEIAMTEEKIVSSLSPILYTILKENTLPFKKAENP